MELVKTLIPILTQGINLEIHPNVIFVRVYFTGPDTVQMRIEVTMKTNKFIGQEAQTLEASDNQNQAEGTQEADIWFQSPNLGKVEMKVFVGETLSCGMLDSGYTQTVCEMNWLSCFKGKLRSQMKGREKCKKMSHH